MAGPLWAEQTATGRPLVLLHGNGESHRVFDRMVPLLVSQRRLVALDSRGHGVSPRGDGPLTIARMLAFGSSPALVFWNRMPRTFSSCVKSHR